MKPNLKHSVISILIGTLLGAIAGTGYIDHKSNESKKEHIEKMKEEKARLIRYEEILAQTDEYLLKRQKQTQPFHVANWTYSLQKMPASQARTDFSDSVVKATQDNIITNEEYLKLESEYSALELTNTINVLKVDLSELVAADVSDKEPTPAADAK